MNGSVNVLLPPAEVNGIVGIPSSAKSSQVTPDACVIKWAEQVQRSWTVNSDATSGQSMLTLAAA